jgi:hypothetical protein
MKKIAVSLSIALSTVIVSGCATYGGYTPAVDDTPIYDQQRQSQYQTPAQPVYTEQPILDKKGRQMYDPVTREPLYRRVQAVDQYGNPIYQQQAQPEYRGPARSSSQDMVECQQIARQNAGTARSAVTGGLMGGALGAATGAAIGAITGNAGSGAAYGAAIGGMGGATQQGYSADQRYKQLFNNCMRSRGHNVLD